MWGRMEPATNSDQLGQLGQTTRGKRRFLQTNQLWLDFYSGDSEGHLSSSPSLPFAQTTIMANSKVHLFAMIDMIFGLAKPEGI